MRCDSRNGCNGKWKIKNGWSVIGKKATTTNVLGQIDYLLAGHFIWIADVHRLATKCCVSFLYLAANGLTPIEAYVSNRTNLKMTEKTDKSYFAIMPSLAFESNPKKKTEKKWEKKPTPLILEWFAIFI